MKAPRKVAAPSVGIREPCESEPGFDKRADLVGGQERRDGVADGREVDVGAYTLSSWLVAQPSWLLAHSPRRRGPRQLLHGRIRQTPARRQRSTTRAAAQSCWFPTSGQELSPVSMSRAERPRGSGSGAGRPADQGAGGSGGSRGSVSCGRGGWPVRLSRTR